MGKRITCTFLLGVTIFVFAIITSYVPTSLILSANTRPYNDTYVLNLGSEQSPTLSETYTNVEGNGGNRSFTYENVKHYDGGLCTIGVDGTITKDLAANNLTSLFIETDGNDTFEVTTSFSANYSNPYIYTCLSNVVYDTIVGNYISIKALDEANIKTITLTYGCKDEDTAYSGVSLSNEDNYVYLDNGEWGHTFFYVKLNSTTQLEKGRITLRNSDNYDNLTIQPEILNKEGDTYVAGFNISKLNADHTGLWTSYTYEPRIYVDNKRVEGCSNEGYLDINTNQNVDLSAIKTNGSDYNNSTCGYKLNKETLNGKDIITISWTNSVDDEKTNFTNKGLRFTKMGKNFDECWEQKITKIGGRQYYLLTGWVSSLEEVQMYAKNYERFALINATTSSNIEFESFANPSESKYEPVDSNDLSKGYKIILAFDLTVDKNSITAIDNNGVKIGVDKQIIAGLKYNGIPYIFRENNNTAALKTAHYLMTGDHESEQHLSNTRYTNPYDYIYYQLQDFWNWTRINFYHYNYYGPVEHQ